MKVYMIGIGGIGMSALAQLYLHDGYTVAGSDKEPSPVTELLEQKGVRVLIGQKADNVASDANIVVYSDAVWADNPERVRAKELGIPERSYFEALGEVSKQKTTLAVSGTHGKTTATGMLAKILIESGASPTAVVGSIMKDFGSNYVAGTSKLLVVEACEYRDHILELTPTILVITNLEWDHTDFFPSLDALKDTFRKAVAVVPASGVIVANLQDKNVASVLADAKAHIVDFSAVEVPPLQVIGDFNRMNARAAKATAKALLPDLSDERIDASLRAYSGTWRRFEAKGKTKEGADVFDDYAHHPTAVRATLRAAREKFKDKKIVVAFHPHLYSRTRDLMEDFATAFADADEVVLAPIYPAREEPIEGVTSKALAEKIWLQGKKVTTRDSLLEIEEYVRSVSDKNTVIITMGAGDIYHVADTLVRIDKEY